MIGNDIPKVDKNRSKKDLMISARKYFKGAKRVLNSHMDSLIVPRSNFIHDESGKDSDRPMSIATYVISCTFKRDNVDSNADFRTYPISEDMIFSRFRFKSKLTDKRKKVKSALDYLEDSGSIVREYLDKNDVGKKGSLFVIKYLAEETSDGRKMFMTIPNDSLDKILNMDTDIEKINSLAVATGIMIRMNVINSDGYEKSVNSDDSWSEALSLNNIVSYEGMLSIGLRTGLDRNTVSVYVNKLVEAEVISVIKVKKHVSKHGGWSNIYSKFEERWLLKRYVEVLADTVLPSKHAALNIVDVWDEDIAQKEATVNIMENYEEDDEYGYEDLDNNGLDIMINIKSNKERV